jgi:hypothetical protein
VDAREDVTFAQTVCAGCGQLVALPVPVAIDGKPYHVECARGAL